MAHTSALFGDAGNRRRTHETVVLRAKTNARTVPVRTGRIRSAERVSHLTIARADARLRPPRPVVRTRAHGSSHMSDRLDPPEGGTPAAGTPAAGTPAADTPAAGDRPALDAIRREARQLLRQA